MKLKEILSQLKQTATDIKVAIPMICGGTPRDKYMNRLENVADLDLTNGEKSIGYLAQEYADRMNKNFNLTYKTMEDGHSTIFLGNLKMDFSSNFIVPGIDGYLSKLNIQNPTDLQREMFSRDFTCNALLMDIELKHIYDSTKRGFDDIQKKIVSTCLAPEITLNNSRNRVIRGIYLCSKLDMFLDPNIIAFVKKHPETVKIGTPKSLEDKLTQAFQYDADKASYLLTQMGLWNHVPILEPMKPYYQKSLNKTAYFQKNSQNDEWKTFLIEWTDLRNQLKHKEYVKAKNKEHAKLYGYDFPHKVDNITEMELSSDQYPPKWIPKPKPFAQSKVPIFTEPNLDFIEYSSEKTYPLINGEIKNFDDAHNIAIKLMKDKPNTALYQDEGGDWWVGENDPLPKKTAYFQGTEQPKPHGQKQYKSDPAVLVQPRLKTPFFRNYDVYHTNGIHDQPVITPGVGWHSMSNFKSIREFLEHNRKILKGKYVADDFVIEDTEENRAIREQMMKTRAAVLSQIVKIAIDFPVDESYQSDPILENSLEYTDPIQMGSSSDTAIFPNDTGVGEIETYPYSAQIGGLLDTYTPRPDFEGKSVDQLDFGRDYSEDDAEPDELDYEDLAKLFQDMLTPNEEVGLYGLPDGISPVSDLDADQTINQPNPFFGETTMGNTMYQDKTNI